MADALSPNKQALLKIRELKQQIEALQAEQATVSEPIAVVSMACRFPRRSKTPELFWQSLMDQTDEVTEIPQDRWDLQAFHDEDPEIPGRMYARHGVFLEDIDEMDPEFFGISPREATWVDPQQRLLMEVGWEAIERACWVPEKIGDRTGVFVGWMHNDYQNEASDSFLNLNPYIATGAAGSFLCGRLAYYLGLRGPSVAVDTACSSSLVALHLACSSLQQRDCDRALVGGVNAICSPTTNILTCKLKALSPTGQSRAFDAAADGYLRGEGCGVVTLRRLSDAQRDGDRIIGVIQGSAIGHNGSGGGLTVPNPAAQEQVIRDALRRAGVAPADVSYLEAHGTGTELGDPIELRAAAAALASERNGSGPLLVGSVKTNIGHLEAAAGMAGLIKVLLAIEHGRIPGQRNFETPNPHIPWDQIDVEVLTKPVKWPSVKPIVGVSAFGMSGTNAHAIVAAPPQSVSRYAADANSDSESNADGLPQLITLSGRTEEGLRELASRYAQHLQDGTQNLSDVAYTTTTGRTHFEYRAAFAAQSVDEAADRLAAIAGGRVSPDVATATAKRPPRTAWQFTGQGSQYLGMGKALYEQEPIFRQAIDQCDALLGSRANVSAANEAGASAASSATLRQVLFDDSALVHHTSWTQPAIFAIQMGLVKLFQSWGLSPDMVLGHSVGQYAAACTAGMMSWEDGLRLIGERGRLIGDLPSGGLMLAAFASLTQVEEVLHEQSFGDSVSIAARNGTHIVLSGEAAPIELLEERFGERSLRTKRLKTSHAFHSSLMDPALGPFREFAADITFSSPDIPLICNVSGEVLPPDSTTDAAYWSDHIRQPVAFAESITRVQELGCELLLEIGPQDHLTRMAAANWTQAAENLVSCLDPTSDDIGAVRQAVARLYVNGAAVDFEAFHHGRHPRRVLLPTYPFQRRRFWGPDKPRADHAEFHTAHPLLGQKISLAGVNNETRYESYVEPDSPPWLPDHQVMEQTVLPGAAFVEMGIAAAAGFPASLSQVIFEQPLRPAHRTPIQTIVRESDATTTIESYSAADGGNWSRHFTAELPSSNEAGRPAPVALGALRQSLSESSSAEAFYAKMNDVGLAYGPAFQVIREIRFNDEAILTRLETQGDIRGFHVAPTLLDGALHSLAVGLLREDDGTLFLPVGIGRVTCFGPVPNDVWCHATWKSALSSDETADQKPGTERRLADVTLFSESGEVYLTIADLQLKQIDRAVLRKMSGVGARRLIYELEWEEFRLPDVSAEARSWLVLSDSGEESAAHLAEELEAAGQQCQSAEWESFGAYIDSESPPAGIVCLLPDEARVSCEGLLELVQQLQAANIHELACGLTLITRSGVAVAPGESCEPDQSKYWGLGRVIGAERPGLRCRILDVDSTAPLSQVVEFLRAETRDNQLGLRSGTFFVPRMKARSHQGSAQNGGASASHEPRSDCSYLITGGLGKLGRQAARWLAENGAGEVVLVSRRAPDEEGSAFLNDIEATGCRVTVHNADISAREDVAALFECFQKDSETGRLLPLCGIIHAAGVLDDALLGEQSWDRFERVLAPKIDAARLLDEFSRELSLDFFVLYSSVAAVLGSPGQSNYATGNAFLDGLAWQRRADGLPATSINWGPWTEGMAADENIVKRLALQGITPLSVEEAHQCMEQILATATTQATVLDVDWRRMQVATGQEPPPMLQDLAPARQMTQGGNSAFAAKLRQLRGPAQKDLLVTTIQELLQQVLSTSEAPETDRPLIEMGLDSLMAVEFSTQLQVMLGESFVVSPTMLFDHPTIDAISDHLLEMVDDAEPEAAMPSPAQAVDTPETVAISRREPIAIVGMSCRFPGAQNVDEFWDNLLNQVDSVREIPADRWDIDQFYDAGRKPGKMYTREGGFLDDIAEFDAAFFNISDQEACWIDPQHRMLLENSYRALEDAGIPTQPLEDRNVGVFMGIMGQDYAFLPRLEDSHIVEAFEGAGLSHSAGVGRISYVFGFEGPSIAVDTASSSSLVAVHQAVRSLQDGNCNMALAGGVNAILAPVNSLLMSKAGLLAPDGRCKSFSAAADGFGRGEGCGVVVLKRLSDAERDGDRVVAVIRGGAVVHNGTTGGITSPSGKAQARVISEALQDARTAPSQVQYLEAHGTGTEFGDPMELGAAASVYGKGRKRSQPMLVGSVKANISHLEAAGGISGLIKTALCLHHGVIPPQMHFDKPSPHIPWRRLPMKMVEERTEWPDTEERIAGVTALGLVGTNAHIVLSSAETAADSVARNSSDTDAGEGDGVQQDSELLVLSARSQTALRDLAAGFSTLIRKSDSDALSLADLCFTAATGRRHYEHRLALVTASGQEAQHKLTEFAKPAQGAADAPLTVDRQNGMLYGHARSSPRLAWSFGSHPIDEAVLRSLFDSEPAARQLISEFDDRLMSDGSSLSIAGWLMQTTDTEESNRPSEHVMLFIHQAAVVAALRQAGVEPDVVHGTGVGQYTAACVAGCLCFKDALAMLIRRDNLSREASDEDLDAFEEYADQFNFYPPNMPLICSVSGDLVPIHQSPGGRYWRDHLVSESGDLRSTKTLIEQDCDIHLWFSAANELSSEPETAMSWFGAETRQDEAPAEFVMKNILSRLYIQGVALDFTNVFAGRSLQKTRLPHYPFQKRRYWITEIEEHIGG